MPQELDRLLSIMARLRDPATGCEWDRAQSFSTIAPYTVEEAYEVMDAIERNDMVSLRGELGDLLLQVVFHSQMADEAGEFTFEDVAAAISDKMEKRHPHIFGDAAESPGWETLKAQERSDDGAESALDGIAAALPALMRAEKLQKRAARSGFDWPDTQGPAEKVAEEAKELADAAEHQRQEEAGDLLFAAVNLVRAYGISPEDALRAANLKFERRFRSMERAAGGEAEFASLSLDEQEMLWNRIKADEAKTD